MTKTQITHLKIARYPELLIGPFRPIHWDIDPSSVCDHTCRGCPYIFDGPIDPMLGVVRPEMVKAKRGFLDFDRYEFFLHEAREFGGKAITFVGGGEPTLHPRFVEMMRAAVYADFKFGVVTHLGRKYQPGFFSTLATATWVRVSVNAGTRETYHKHQGRDHFNQVVENTVKAVSAGCRVGWSFLVMSGNWAEIYSAAELARDAGASYIQYKPLIGTAGGSVSTGMVRAALKRVSAELVRPGFQVLDQWSSRAEELKRHDEHEFSGKCHVARFNPKLGANGVVYQCCELAYSDEGAIGSIYKNSLEWILGEAAKKTIDQAGCPHCWAKPVNTAINAGEFDKIEAPPLGADSEFV